MPQQTQVKPQQRPPAARLTAPMREINRVHLQRRAQSAMEYIGQTLCWAGIHGLIRVQMGQTGRPRIVVTVQGLGTPEAQLLLPPTFGAFDIRVI